MVSDVDFCHMLKVTVLCFESMSLNIPCKDRFYCIIQIEYDILYIGQSCLLSVEIHGCIIRSKFIFPDLPTNLMSTSLDMTVIPSRSSET